MVRKIGFLLFFLPLPLGGEESKQVILWGGMEAYTKLESAMGKVEGSVGGEFYYVLNESLLLGLGGRYLFSRESHPVYQKLLDSRALRWIPLYVAIKVYVPSVDFFYLKGGVGVSILQGERPYSPGPYVLGGMGTHIPVYYTDFGFWGVVFDLTYSFYQGEYNKNPPVVVKYTTLDLILGLSVSF